VAIDTRLTITDRNCVPVSQPVRDWSDIDAELRFNEVIGASFTAAAHPELLDVLVPGHRVVLRDQGQIFKSGPIEGWDYLRSATGEAAAPGRVIVTWADDGAHLANRITYPDPSEPATNQTADAQWTGTDPAGTLMLALVDLNAGAGALTARQVPQLTSGDGTGLGANITYATRYEDLYEALRNLALLGGGSVPGGHLGFRVHQVARDLVFEVYEPRDRTGIARFGWSLGNLKSAQVTTQAPTSTVAIVAGPGEGTARNIVERIDTSGVATWWRSEEFVDQRQAETTDELEQAGDEALEEGREQLTVVTETVDTPQVVYGDAYQVGDLALVIPGTGAPISDVVRAVRLQITPSSGRVRTALVGNQAATADPVWVAGNRTLARRIAQIERV
jgi:hypothetical protein